MIDAPQPPLFQYSIACTDKASGEKQKFPLVYATNTDGSVAISLFGLQWFDPGNNMPGFWGENPWSLNDTTMTQSTFGSRGTLINLVGRNTVEEPPAVTSYTAVLAFRGAVDFSQPLALDQFSAADSSYAVAWSSEEPPENGQSAFSIQSLAPDSDSKKA
jgi:hypothetical protein